MDDVLLQKIAEIKDTQWIKSVNNNDSGIGLTLEKLLGKQVENFEWPDFKGVEVKAKLARSRYDLTLFTAAPDSILFAAQEVRNRYGYPDRKLWNCKVFNTSIFANDYKSMSNRYYMRLYVDWKKDCVTFQVYNRKYELIDDEIAWSFSMLQEKLERKLAKLLVVTCEQKMIDNEKYYRYTHFKYYELKSFAHFLRAIEQGGIYVAFQISVFKGDYKYGQMHDRGTAFIIKNDKIDEVFKLVKEI